jgi:hypothetical protein
MLVRFTAWLLRNGKLSQENKIFLTNQLLSTVGALPLHATFTVDETGKLLMRGVPVEYEQAVMLRESATNILHSKAWRAVKEQVLYEAVSKGIHEALNNDQILFAKAAIWFCEQQDKTLKVLAQDPGNSLLSGD